MAQTIFSRRMDNGLAVIGEPMDWLESVAVSILMPGGCMYDPPDKAGLATLTCEMIERGCGDRDSRKLVEDLEMLGSDYSCSVTVYNTILGGVMLKETLDETFGIFADIVRRPMMPVDQLEDGRALCIQEARALEDDLAQRALNELSSRYYPEPFGRHREGTPESLQAITMDDIREHYTRCYQPQNGVLSIAGNFDWDSFCECTDRLFGDWKTQELPPVQSSSPTRGYTHLPCDSAQTHIAIAYPNVPYGHKDYYQAWAAVGILSDGMSSRLFTEVREKRGLAYTVSAFCHSRRELGSVMCYAGTTAARAQETLDVVLDELRKMEAGVEQDELDRLKARIKTSLIMQQESSRARASSIAADWFYLSRVQTMDELSAIIDELTCDSINEYLAAHPPSDFTVVTLGEEALQHPETK